MKSFLNLNHTNDLHLPEPYQQDDVRSSDNLAATFLQHYTQPGDTVFDPFAGFGTTLYMSEKLGRVGYGVEYLPERVRYIQSVIRNKSNILCGSALELDKLPLPIMDFSFTSPPYMSKNNHAQYPFAAYRVTGADYDQYLADIKTIYRQLNKILKPDAYAVVEVSNIINEGVMTPLAWDVARAIGEVMTLEREIIVAWEGEETGGSYGFGYDHCYCLVFRNHN